MCIQHLIQEKNIERLGENGENTCTLFFRDYCDTFYADSTIGFRIVRTVLI